MRRALALGALCALTACRPAVKAPATVAKIESCSYGVTLTAQGRADVVAQCRGDAAVTFRVAEPHLRRHLKSSTPGAAGRFRSSNGRLEYQVDLAALAAEERGFDSAQRLGASFITAMSSVLLVPEPLTTEILVQVALTVPADVAFATGLKRDAGPGQYRLMAHEIPVATYLAFGKLEQQTLKLGKAELEVTKLDGATDASFSKINDWIAKSAQAVSAFYGEFPVPRASVMVIPARGRQGVVFGKVLPESEPGVALVLGQHASARAMYGDWILVHELYHLGFPSFFGEGRWLDEGLATYYEPIIRVRAGLYTERELWDELEKSMPQGLAAYTDYGLEKAVDFRGVYWGGAIACLVADVEARRRDARRGLEVGLRALREAGGNASEVWSVADVVSSVDRTLGAPTLAPVIARHGERGSPFDLGQLMRDLGVIRKPNGALVLSDAAPLAAVRKAIVYPPPP